MELLERYLEAVRSYLLRGRRDDIVKELGDNILSQMEDKAEELGRPLTQAEQAAILKQHGHPVLAAARYRRLPLQQLIGPTLFPLYWYAVQAMVVFVLLFHAVLGLVLVLKTGSLFTGMAEAWGSFCIRVLTAIGGLTVGFGLVEYFCRGKIPFTETFDPLELPEVRKSTPSRISALGDLVFGTMVLAGLPVLLHAPTPEFARTIHVHMAPAWWHFEVPILAGTALGVAAAAVAVFGPQYPRIRAGLRLASDITGIVTFYFLLMAKQFIVIGPEAGAKLNEVVHVGSRVLTVGQIANYAVGLVPFIFMIFLFGDGVAEVVRLARDRRSHSSFTHESTGIL